MLRKGGQRTRWMRFYERFAAPDDVSVELSVDLTSTEALVLGSDSFFRSSRSLWRPRRRPDSERSRPTTTLVPNGRMSTSGVDPSVRITRKVPFLVCGLGRADTTEMVACRSDRMSPRRMVVRPHGTRNSSRTGCNLIDLEGYV